jgi:hypothetical protein
LLFYTACNMDTAGVAEGEEKEKLQGMVELLTPVCKAWCSDWGFRVTEWAVQTYGGYGYTMEYPAELYLRDQKITSIYEGTNGIQALDLIGRKLSQNNGQAIQDLFALMKSAIGSAQDLERTAPVAARFATALARLEATTAHMTTTMQADPLTGSAHAFSFMEAVGDMVMAWMLLWRANLAAAALQAGAKEKDQAFYEGQIMSAEFYTRNLLPVTLGRMEAILGASSIANDISEDAFGGK